MATASARSSTSELHDHIPKGSKLTEPSQAMPQRDLNALQRAYLSRSTFQAAWLLSVKYFICPQGANYWYQVPYET
jgi:hypothetical protein